jgi:hypothetical protein
LTWYHAAHGMCGRMDRWALRQKPAGLSGGAGTKFLAVVNSVMVCPYTGYVKNAGRRLFARGAAALKCLVDCFCQFLIKSNLDPTHIRFVLFVKNCYKTGGFSVTEIEYRSHLAWSKSDLDLIAKSPMAWKWAREEEPEPTAAMLFGSALHSAILTPKEYELDYVVCPKFDKRTKEGKAGYLDFVEKNLNKKVIAADDDELIVAMAEQVFHHPLAKLLLTIGESEKPLFWTDERTGLDCKCRPDYLRVDGVCVDLKSTTNCLPHEFARSVFKYRYHVQAAYYSDGIEAATGSPVTDFVFLTIEKEPPFGLMVYRLDDDSIEAGRKEYRRDLDTIVEWKKTPDLYKNVVYLDSKNIVEISLPAWANQ